MSEVVAVCRIELGIPAASLKDKRQVIRSVTRRLRNKFNVAVAEVAALNQHQLAVIAVVTVSNDRNYAHGLLSRVVRWVEESRLDCDLVDYEIEMI